MRRLRTRHESAHGAARIVHTRSEQETQQVGRQLGAALCSPAVVLLCGSLGSGKTTLARGMAEGLGVSDAATVHSPSYTLVNNYRGRVPVYHVDLYRLEGNRDLHSVGLEDFLGEDGVSIVEWGERLVSRAEAALVVEIEDAGGEERILRIYDHRHGVRRKRSGKHLTIGSRNR
jgi:tRNA threonylcarbamoyladenosine biosynthesis protein TsaE